MRSLIFVVLTCAASVFVQQVGDTVVVVTQDDAKLIVGEEVVQTVSRGNHLTIENSDDNSYFVTWEHKSGWISKRDVLPLNAALQYFTDAIKREPRARDFAIRGNIWATNGQHDEAISDYNESIRLNPKDSATYNHRGISWADKGEYDIAISDYNEAIRLDPKYYQSYGSRASAWHNKGDYDKAIADYNEIIRLDPKIAKAYGLRGRASAAKGDYDKAFSDYTEAIQLDPKSAVAYSGLAWLLATCPDASYRRAKHAVESARKACELSDWKVPKYIGNLAAAYAEAGDFDEAVKWQTRALSMYSDKDKKEWGFLIDLYKSGKPYRDEP
jgi:tetratricopeptide (TPR) repeat protein